MPGSAARSRLPPTRHHVLSLYRRLLQQASLFKDYNFRETALRKTKEQFHASRGVSDVSQLSRLYQSGVAQLATLQRQTTVHNLYHHQPYIIETLKDDAHAADSGHVGRGWRLKKQGQAVTAGEIERDVSKEKEQLTSFTYNAHDSH